jgi:hypothetical protein
VLSIMVENNYMGPNGVKLLVKLNLKSMTHLNIG